VHGSELWLPKRSQYEHAKSQYRVSISRSPITPRCLGASRRSVSAVDATSGEIVASDLTARRTHDSTQVPALLEQIPDPIASLSADGGASGTPPQATASAAWPKPPYLDSRRSSIDVCEVDRSRDNELRWGTGDWSSDRGFAPRPLFVSHATCAYVLADQSSPASSLAAATMASGSRMRPTLPVPMMAAPAMPGHSVTSPDSAF
jgi:Transposase DDE domain